jgi:hypothetical protein
VKDTSDDGGQDSDEEKEEHEKEEDTMKGRSGTTRMRWWGDGSASGSASSR